MINSFPQDFSTRTYDVHTTDGLSWHFESDGVEGALVTGPYRQPLQLQYGRVTLLDPYGRSINLHGFDIGDTHFELDDVFPNKHWTPPPPPPDPERLYSKERAFVAKLLQYATEFGVNLAALPDINIATMLLAAQTAGATDAQIAGASAILLALTRDIEAEAGMLWVDCWHALKFRIPTYIAELTA